MYGHAVEEEQHEKHAGEDGQAEPLIRRLRAGVAARVANDLAARFPAQRICDALEALPARRCSNAAGWLVRAMISGGWQLHDQAERLRAARTRASQRHDDALATQAQQERRDHRLAGSAAAVLDALTDTQLAAADQRVTRPVGGLDRRSVPVAASRLLAWAVTTATTHQTSRSTQRSTTRCTTTPATRRSTDRRCQMTSTSNSDHPSSSRPDALRRRVRHAIDDLQTAHPSHEPKPQGGSNAP
jgi:hypothetical protein